MIYPVDIQLEQLLEKFVDPDTGELLVSEEFMEEQIELLYMEFEEEIVQLRNGYINDVAEAEAIKKEKIALGKRQKAAENRAEWKKRFIAYLLKGEKFKKGATDIGYRKSEKLAIEDREALLKWAKQEGLEFLTEPDLREGDIKLAIKNGTPVPFAHIEIKNNIQVK